MNLSHLNHVTPLHAALFYATELHLKVFPLHTPLEDEWIDVSIEGKAERMLRCSCGDPKCVSNSGKHPRIEKGLLNATTDEGVIRSWWARWPKANIAIVMGEQLAAIDADPRHGGLKSLPEVIALSPNLEKTLIATTGGDGYHYVAKVPLAAGKIGTRTGVWPGIDIRSDGGYIVASPSLHRSGRRYQWSDSDAEIQELDVKFLERIRRQLKEADTTLLAESSIRIPEGQRNDALFRIACQKCALQWSQGDTLAHIHRQNHERCDPPLEEDEVHRIVASAYRYDSSYAFTDVGNAERLRDTYGKDIRWSPSLHWLVWEDGHWEPTGDEAPIGLAILETKQMYAIGKQHDDEELMKWARRSQTKRSIDGMVSLLKPSVLVKTEEVNRHPLWLPCLNGLYEIDSGIFREPRREDLILRRIPVKYDANATAPLWERSVLRWMDGDKEMTRFLQQMVGYFLTGDTRHHSLFIFWGGGANGKSTFSKILDSLLGPFSIAMGTDMLMRYSHISKEQEGARLFGTRLAICSEAPENATLDIEVVKSLTGGDRVRAKVVYKTPFDFEPTHKILLHTNEKPKLSYNDEAAWRRMNLIPFPVRIPDREQDPELPRRLSSELPGILNWALDGARTWYSQGRLETPKAVQDATKAYRREMDEMGTVLAEVCEFGGKEIGTDFRVRADLLFKRYQVTVTGWGRKPKMRMMFYDYMRNREDIRESSHGGVTYYSGVRLKEDNGVSLER